MENNNCYIDLAIAVVRQAAEDYQRAWKKFKRTGKKSDRLIEVEQFFESEYGHLLSFGCGEQIMESIRSGVPVYYDGRENNGKGRYIIYDGKRLYLSREVKHFGKC